MNFPPRVQLPRIPHWPFLILPALSEFLGATLNQLALIANGGQMPVLFPGWAKPDLSDDPIHVPMTALSHLKWLSDIFNFHVEIDSLGDLFLGLGETTFVFGLVIWIVLMIQDANRK